MVVIGSSPFGGKTRTAVLLALRLLNESHARELARILGTPLAGVQKALAGLEAASIVAAKAAGRTKLYRINPRYFAYEDLQRYLLRLSEPEEELRHRVEHLRRRPRRAGKPL